AGRRPGRHQPCRTRSVKSSMLLRHVKVSVLSLLYREPYIHLPPVVAIPFNRNRCPNRKIIKMGISETSDMAKSEPHAESEPTSTNARKATGTVYLSGLVR